MQCGAEPSSPAEPPAVAPAKLPRRIIPEPIGGPAAPPATAAAAGSSAAAAPSGGAPKQPRRITAEPVGPMPAPTSAAKSSLPAESAASGKRRITPTPLRAAEVSQQFGGAAAQPQVGAQRVVTGRQLNQGRHNGACVADAPLQRGRNRPLAAKCPLQAAQPAPSEMSRDGAPASGRRITPIPVGAAQTLPQGEERTATAVARFGIAAMAAAAGKQAAQERGQ